MIKIRYHHLLCIPRFEGKGYNKKFTDNLAEIEKEFVSGNYELTDGCDDICKACPNKLMGRCLTNKKVRKYDSKVKEYIDAGKIPKPADICTDCRWYYICKNK